MIIYFGKDKNDIPKSVQIIDVKATQAPVTLEPNVVNNITPHTIDQKEEQNESPSLSHEERIAEAERKIQTSSVSQRIDGMRVLSELAPERALRAIYEGVNRLAAEPDIEGMIVFGSLRIGHHDDILTSEDIRYLYATSDNDNIRGRLARILSVRNDDSLLIEYLQNMKPKLSQSTNEERRELLLTIGSMESRQSVPFIKPYLTDEDERVQNSAFTALGLSGNSLDVSIAQSLLLSNSARTRSFAEATIETLESKGEHENPPLDMVGAWEK